MKYLALTAALIFPFSLFCAERASHVKPNPIVVTLDSLGSFKDGSYVPDLGRNLAPDEEFIRTFQTSFEQTAQIRFDNLHGIEKDAFYLLANLLQRNMLVKRSTYDAQDGVDPVDYVQNVISIDAYCPQAAAKKSLTPEEMAIIKAVLNNRNTGSKFKILSYIDIQAESDDSSPESAPSDDLR